jgi:hypothetical protein
MTEKIKPRAKFLCFGAAGEVCVRELIQVGDWLGPSTLCLLDVRGGYHSYWPLKEVVPLNREARLFMAKAIFRAEREEFVRWRREKFIHDPSLKTHYKRIEEVV